MPNRCPWVWWKDWKFVMPFDLIWFCFDFDFDCQWWLRSTWAWWKDWRRPLVGLDAALPGFLLAAASPRSWTCTWWVMMMMKRLMSRLMTRMRGEPIISAAADEATDVLPPLQLLKHGHLQGSSSASSSSSVSSSSSSTSSSVSASSSTSSSLFDHHTFISITFEKVHIYRKNYLYALSCWNFQIFFFLKTLQEF